LSFAEARRKLEEVLPTLNLKVVIGLVKNDAVERIELALPCDLEGVHECDGVH
jgi:hypothetical protein